MQIVSSFDWIIDGLSSYQLDLYHKYSEKGIHKEMRDAFPKTGVNNEIHITKDELN